MTSTEPNAPKRRGRPPLAEDNETRERLLNAAQQLFAERSFTQVSVREITDAAGLGVAAINYHFGSKDGLLMALFKRSAPALIEERERLLRLALASRGSTEARLRAVLHALLAPVIRWSRQPQTQRFFVPFFTRLQLDGPPEVKALATTGIAHLKPFVQGLQQVLPSLSAQEVSWRLHFVLGIEHSLHHEATRLESLLGTGVDLGDVESMIERVVDFCVPGWLAAARHNDPSH